MNKTYYSLRLNAFETGLLMGLLERHRKTDGVFENIYAQLVDLKKQIEAADGVKKTLLPDGLVRLDDGETVITRPMMEWEKKELEGKK